MNSDALLKDFLALGRRAQRVVNAEGTNNELDIINELPNEQSAASERSPDDKARCAECGLKNEVMKQCARCIGIVYCSRECQVKQWHRHKLNCWPKVEKFLLSGTPVEKSSSGNTDGGESNEVQSLDTSTPLTPFERWTSFAAISGSAPATYEVSPCGNCWGEGLTCTSKNIVDKEICPTCGGKGVYRAFDDEVEDEAEDEVMLPVEGGDGMCQGWGANLHTPAPDKEAE